MTREDAIAWFAVPRKFIDRLWSHTVNNCAWSAAKKWSAANKFRRVIAVIFTACGRICIQLAVLHGRHTGFPRRRKVLVLVLNKPLLDSTHVCVSAKDLGAKSRSLIYR